MSRTQRSWLLTTTLSLLSLSTWISTVSAHGDPFWRQKAAKYGWLTDYNKAKAEAKKTGKPMMVFLRCIP